MKFVYPPGATPIDANEAAGLIPSHISLQSELNEWEETNILEGRTWAFGRKRKDLFSERFIKRLHREMFKNTWKWAGQFRTTDKNIGVPTYRIAQDLKNLCDDAEYWTANHTYPDVEIAVRFHHRLDSIHPFSNGNGRHARLMADLIMRRFGLEPLTWGRIRLTTPVDTRHRYIKALRAADGQNIQPLINFAQS
jgi:Fic-DOC domain mobile mystery protein B